MKTNQKLGIYLIAILSLIILINVSCLDNSEKAGEKVSNWIIDTTYVEDTEHVEIWLDTVTFKRDTLKIKLDR